MRINIPVQLWLYFICCLAPASLALAQASHPPPALYGTDTLGRSMPAADEVREFQRDRYVGMFYFTWLNLPAVYDNTKILASFPNAVSTTASPPWGPKNAFHFWGEPLYGYYRSDDPWILRRHAALLSDAGVDFLIFDATNAAIYADVILQLCQVFEEQRQLGEHVPQLAFMVNTQAGETADRILNTFYLAPHASGTPSAESQSAESQTSQLQYSELWFHWQGKPLLLCDPSQASPEVALFFTLRKAHWPFELVDTHNAWHWEATYPQVYSYDTGPLQPEELSVSVGQNLHQADGRVEMMSTGKARGRSFHNGKVDERPEAYKYGFNFEEQWQRAFELDPQVVFITGWNEWIAMQLNHGEGRPVFCDQFDVEFSRDVEMMKGGYADNYYMQLAANIRRYKGMRPAQVCTQQNSIDTGGPFEQWQEISHAYVDQANETLPRDFPGCGDTHYQVTSGRNDFRTLKVGHDEKNIYFYAQTTDAITPSTDANWMWLLLDVKELDVKELDVKDPSRPNWEGFQYLINRHSLPSDQAIAETTVEVCVGQWNWQAVGSAHYRVEGNQMQLAVPKSLLGIAQPAEESSFAIEFKWIDNTQSAGDIIDLYTHGDTAPAGRFRYRFEAR